MPTPSYSPSDLATAFGVVLSFILDVLVGLGVIPAIDPQTRLALIGALTLLTLFLIDAYRRNRAVKHQAQTAVMVAQAAGTPTQPSSPAAAPTGTFMLVPVPASGTVPPPTK